MKRWLYLEFWWAIHNLIAHPCEQVCWWASLCGLIRPVANTGQWFHDWTVPVHEPEEGRG
jgi:hypothetical protein